MIDEQLEEVSEALVGKLAAQRGLTVWWCGVRGRHPEVSVVPGGESPVALTRYLDNAVRMGARALYVDAGGGDGTTRLTVDFFVDGILHRWASAPTGAADASGPGLADDLVADPAFRPGRSLPSRDGMAPRSVGDVRSPVSASSMREQAHSE